VADILDLAALERLLATAYGAGDGWLHLAQGARTSVPKHMVDHEGMLDLAQIRAALAAGNSLYLTKAERLSTSLMALARAVELDLATFGVTLRRSVNAHVFLTPPGSQAFLAHRDEHASFVVQLEGCKDWVLYEAPSEVRVTGMVEPGCLAAAATATFRLEPGDVLYMPEWWAHEAQTSETHSLHVTLRVFPLRWADLVRELGDAHPVLGDVVPRHLALDSKPLSDALVELVCSPRFRQSLEPAVDAIIRRSRTPSVVLPDDGLRQVLQADRIGMDTMLEKSAGVTCDVRVEGDEVALSFPGGTIRGPGALADVFDFVAAASALYPADLPALDAGPYDRLDVARRLVAGGLLRVAHSAREPRPSPTPA
jgi:hypothetical protein